MQQMAHISAEQDYSERMSKMHEEGGGVPTWVGNTVSSVASSAGYFESSYRIDAKQTIKYGQRINGQVRSAETLTRANRMGSLSTAKGLSRVGAGLAVVSVGLTIYDGLTGKDGWQNHHNADLIIAGALYGTALAVPVVGWIAGGLYLAADLTS